ncbi:Rv3654c family TadE-like protein [Kitasatospora sp. NPDC054939]
MALLTRPGRGPEPRQRRLRRPGQRARSAAHPGKRQPDGGSATIWLLAVGLLGCAVFGATLALGAVVAARHRAESAADLAALAAADRLLLDADGGCARAAGIAGAHRAALVRCTVEPAVDAVEVVVEVPVTGLPRSIPVLLGPARARARAGPARAPGPAEEEWASDP